jgi:hypothetical protein
MTRPFAQYAAAQKPPMPGEQIHRAKELSRAKRWRSPIDGFFGNFA